MRAGGGGGGGNPSVSLGNLEDKLLMNQNEDAGHILDAKHLLGEGGKYIEDEMGKD